MDKKVGKTFGHYRKKLYLCTAIKENNSYKAFGV